MYSRNVLLLISFILFPVTLSSQTHQGEYLKISYFNVEPDRKAQFLRDIQGKGKSESQSLIDSGEITGWYLYKVNYAGSRNPGYNFVTVASAHSLSAFDGPGTFSAGLQENGPGDENNRSRTSSPDFSLSGVLQHSELWKVQNSVSRNETYKPSRFKLMDYMQVTLGREYEYQMFEDEVARPLHETRMKEDRMNAWELYQLIIPGGTQYGYNFSTGNFFNALDHIEYGFTDEMIRANHPDVDLMDFFQTIFSARDLVQSDVWELIDFARPE